MRRHWLLRLVSTLGVRMGHVPSMVTLGEIYEVGPEGIDAANELYRRAAEQGSGQAMCRLGINHFPTKGGATDSEQAVAWLEQALALEDSMAAWALGRMHLAGGPVEKNVARGLELLRRSADAGYAPACLSLAQIYRAGSHGVNADTEQAVAWFIRSRSRMERLRIRLGLARVEVGG